MSLILNFQLIIHFYLHIVDYHISVLFHSLVIVSNQIFNLIDLMKILNFSFGYN